MSSASTQKSKLKSIQEGNCISVNRRTRLNLEWSIELHGDNLTPAMLFGIRTETCYSLRGNVSDGHIQTVGRVIHDGVPDFDLYQHWYSGFRCAVAGEGMWQLGWWCHEDGIAHEYLVPDQIEIGIMTQNEWWSTSLNTNTRNPPQLLLLSSRHHNQYIFRAFEFNSSADDCKELALVFND